ncbi:MAG: ImmA/IrrE family metallo-endopeptidase [Lachnospiraceae bacterium]|nr:ImmA/IrrE family metallo-endopeptidase [Lachnospiraceae bacterium]
MSHVSINVDFSKVYKNANEILVANTIIETFPYKISSLIKEQTDIRICTYTKALEKYGIDNRVFGSNSADIKEFCGAYVIFCNDNEPEYRVRYSVAHEMGHYVNGHKMNIKVDDPLYEKQEIEANCFAAQILMPEQIIREFRHRGKVVDVDFLVDVFGVSEDAAQKRLKTLAKVEYEWRNRSEKEYDDLIIMKYSTFIDKVAPLKKQRFFYESNYEDDLQRERDSWLDSRTRWS